MCGVGYALYTFICNKVESDDEGGATWLPSGRRCFLFVVEKGSAVPGGRPETTTSHKYFWLMLTFPSFDLTEPEVPYAEAQDWEESPDEFSDDREGGQDLYAQDRKGKEDLVVPELRSLSDMQEAKETTLLATHEESDECDEESDDEDGFSDYKRQYDLFCKYDRGFCHPGSCAWSGGPHPFVPRSGSILAVNCNCVCGKPRYNSVHMDKEGFPFE